MTCLTYVLWILFNVTIEKVVHTFYTQQVETIHKINRYTSYIILSIEYVLYMNGTKYIEYDDKNLTHSLTIPDPKLMIKN